MICGWAFFSPDIKATTQAQSFPNHTRAILAPPWPQAAAYVHVPSAPTTAATATRGGCRQDSQMELYVKPSPPSWHAGEPSQCTASFLGGASTYLSSALSNDCLLPCALADSAPDAEFTVESNPGTLDGKGYRTSRTRRQSDQFGESFHPRLLRLLSETTSRPMCRGPWTSFASRIPWVSLDLIFGTPGQTLAEWDRSGIVPALGPDHFHLGLTYEKELSSETTLSRARSRP